MPVVRAIRHESDVADQLEREGVTSFQKAFDELIDALSSKAADLQA